MNRSEQIKIVGAMGEQIVKECLEKNGHSVTLSESQYDRVKDMVADGKTVEVKTFIEYVKYNSFGLKPNQWQKCDNVDRLFFVRVPLRRGEAVLVYESVSRKFDDQTLKDLRLYGLQDLELYDTITDVQICNRIYDLSPSTWKGRL